MKLSIPLILIGLALSGCAATDRCTDVPGVSFKTDPACKRARPACNFDPRCDCPKLGFKDFVRPCP